MTAENTIQEADLEESKQDEQELKKQPFAIRALKKLIKWTVTIVICVVFYNFVSSLQEEQKEKFFSSSKSQAVSSCKRDTECISKVNKYFDSCIGDNYTSHRSGKYNRKYILDLEGLNYCIASK